MAESRTITTRLPNDMIEKLSLESSASAVIRTALEEYYHRQGEEKVAKAVAIPSEVYKEDLVDSKEKYPAFKIPVGDTICWDTKWAKSQLWWCPPNKIELVRDLCKPFTDCGGFTFHVGQDNCGSWYMPEVIMELRQERKRNGGFHVGCQMTPAYLGDRMVWLEIADIERAKEILAERSDIPCAVRCDIHKYSDDDNYKTVYELVNEYYMYYDRQHKPKRINKVGVTSMSPEDIAFIYDV